MTFKQIIDYVDAVRPNPFDTDTKLKWLCEAEGLVLCEIHGKSADNIREQIGEEDIPAAFLPYSRLYAYYLFAMIDFLLSDYDRYKISSEMFEKAMEMYGKYCIRRSGV
ncbi:MAG: hypothetical protein E7667_05445 [Ruminococcaceae bacterium]|nr:hypothetical protein [Oscillospiraceae bacterium]